jgi:hypothetical protein
MNMLYDKIYKYENVIHTFMILVWNDLFIFKLRDDLYWCFILLVIFGLVCFVLLICFAIFSFLLCLFFVSPQTFCYVFPLMLVVASEYHGLDFLLHNLATKSWDIA